MAQSRANGAAAVVLCLIGSAAAIVVVAMTPVYVSFPVAIAMAAGWCIWLERHAATTRSPGRASEAVPSRADGALPQIAPDGRSDDPQ